MSTQTASAPLRPTSNPSLPANIQSGLRAMFLSWSIFIPLLMAAAIFVADLFTPLGVASGVPYSLAILASLNSRSRSFIIGLAVLCCILTITDILVGPGRGGSELWKVLTNRAMAISMIAITTALGLMRLESERRRRVAEERTRKHLADLAHMERVKTAGQLATSLAHELNQPLLAISMQSEVAGQLVGKGKQEHLEQTLGEITEQAHRAAAIIKTLRSMVRKAEPVQVPLDLNTLIMDAIRLIEPQADENKIKLRVRLTDHVSVHGDQIQLGQVMVNLLQNSIDALTESYPEVREIKITSAGIGYGEIEVRVSDSGKGIQPDETNTVFERFFTSKPNGMGMGLAISRSIIEAHGGRLWATSDEQDGTTFRFVLPTLDRFSEKSL